MHSLHMPISRYYLMEEFAELRDYGYSFDWLQMGGVEPAGEVIVSRRGAGPRVERRGSEVIWGKRGRR